MIYKLVPVLMLCCLPVVLKSQALFSEVYKGCNTVTMTLESDTASITKDPKAVADLLIDNISEPLMRTLSGKIFLQIIVYSDGSNCVYSIDNQSTVDSEQLKLKSIFDNKLSWDEHNELPISVLIELTFNNGKLNYRRLGVNAEKGWHELYNAGRPE